VQAISFATAPLRLHLAALALVGACVGVGGPVFAADETAAAAAPASAASAGASVPGTALQASPTLQALPRGEAARQLPIVLQAQKITGQPDQLTQSEGDVEFRRGGLVVRADRLSYDTPEDRAHGQGNVKITREGAVYSGPELMLNVQRFEGYFLAPTFEFLRMGTSGRADRIDFLGESRSRATQASYTSCPLGTGDEPDWQLRMRSVEMDFDANEGRAEGAVLRFLGTPILALPSLSFPLNDARKSGWLPPTINLDNRSGLELSMPYYWNIAPNRDATLAPRIITRRGLGLDSEFRYLEPTMDGTLQLNWLPHDRLAGRSRHAVGWVHEGRLGAGFEYRADLARVSDPEWWKDFPDSSRGFTPRLLPLHAAVERPFQFGTGQGLVYARATRWQVLQASDSFITSPYERSPQLGVNLGGKLAGWQYGLEAEYNRFTLPHDQQATTGRLPGERTHALGSLSHPLRAPGWWVVPKVSFNAASYNAGSVAAAGAGSRSRVIPSFSLDIGLELERTTQAFGRTLHQTLEPRILYVNTPFRDQTGLPNYDAAAKDFNFVSLYADNAFSGVDRVSDAHQITAGFTTRLVDAVSGGEALRVGLVQRYLLRDQLVTPQADGTPGGEPLTQRLSDALFLASTSVLPNWGLDAAVQYSPEISRSIRSIVGVRYSPGPFRTIAGTYRFARGLSEQLELGWQWPLGGGSRTGESPALKSGGGSCSGAWYSVGRVNYSLKDRRVNDSVLGLEYDAGCWIARVVAMRISTGRSEATTRLGIQLELTGFSKLNVGSNPLKVLKDNIPGYRLLREEPSDRASP
jgi:LPS-assembly protein